MVIKKILRGGPMDGEEVEIHIDNLKLKPILNTTNDKGQTFSYGLDDNDEFVWLPNPDDPKIERKWSVCDDDGNVISEEKTQEDALRTLDDLNRESYTLLH